jgi:hypothetical protein
VDLEAGAVTVLVTRRDHSNTAPRNAVIVFIQSPDLTVDRGTDSL